MDHSAQQDTQQNTGNNVTKQPDKATGNTQKNTDARQIKGLKKPVGYSPDWFF